MRVSGIFFLLVLLTVGPLRAQEATDTTIYISVDEMPRFPGCEQLDTTLAVLQACAEQSLLNFVYSNVQYPMEARMEGIEGTVVVRFVVEKEGTISNLSVLRDPGGGTAAEALRVVGAMNDVGVRWKPGKRNGEPVRTQFNLPIRFRLEEPVPYELYGQDTVYTRFDEAPKLLAAEDSLNLYLQQQIRFPKGYADTCLIGDMEVSLLVKADGTAEVLDVSDYNNLGYDFQFELIAAGNATSGKWQPATFEGRPVTTLVNASVLFEPTSADCAMLINDFTRANRLIEEGLTLYNQGEIETGLGKMSEAVSLFPDHANFRYMRGQAYMNENLLDQACEDFLIVREVLPLSIANDLINLICP